MKYGQTSSVSVDVSDADSLDIASRCRNSKRLRSTVPSFTIGTCGGKWYLPFLDAVSYVICKAIVI